jgi:diacylglycerol kinase family enzyme
MGSHSITVKMSKTLSLAVVQDGKTITFNTKFFMAVKAAYENGNMQVMPADQIPTAVKKALHVRSAELKLVPWTVPNIAMALRYLDDLGHIALPNGSRAALASV